jgi:hypothetical protein
MPSAPRLVAFAFAFALADLSGNTSLLLSWPVFKTGCFFQPKRKSPQRPLTMQRKLPRRSPRARHQIGIKLFRHA